MAPAHTVLLLVHFLVLSSQANSLKTQSWCTLTTLSWLKDPSASATARSLLLIPEAGLTQLVAAQVTKDSKVAERDRQRTMRLSPNTAATARTHTHTCRCQGVCKQLVRCWRHLGRTAGLPTSTTTTASNTVGSTTAASNVAHVSCRWQPKAPAAACLGSTGVIGAERRF